MKDNNKIELKEELNKLKETNIKILNQIDNMLVVLEDLQEIIEKLKEKN